MAGAGRGWWPQAGLKWVLGHGPGAGRPRWGWQGHECSRDCDTYSKTLPVTIAL